MGSLQRNLNRQDLSLVQPRTHSQRPHHAPAPKFRLGDFLVVTFCVCIGLAVRLDFLIPNNFVIDADEAIVGLMAKHIAEGQPIPVFYYGQNYMGSFEPLLVSILFKLFGVSNIALQAVPLFFSLLLIPLSYLIARELAGRGAGRVAALLMAVPPAALTIWSAKARGGFIELVFLGALVMLVCVRWLKRREAPITGTVLMGLILGFGWWVNNQIIFFMLPVAFAIFSKLAYSAQLNALQRATSIFRHALAGTLAFFIGGLPFWIFNLQHNFVSFRMFTKAPKSEILDHVQGLFSTSIPIIFGAKHFWESHDIFPGSTAVAYGLYGVVLVTLLATYARDFFNLFRLRLNTQAPIMLLLVFLAVTAGVFVTSSFGHLVQAPRYLLPAYVALIPLTAVALLQIHSRMRGISALLFCCFLAFNIASSYVGGRAIPGEPIVYYWDRVAHDHTDLIHWLNQNGYRWIRTNYWIGYRLAFETREQIRFVVFQEPHNTRIQSYRTEAKQNGEEFMPLVLSPAQTPMVEAALSALGYRYSKIEIDGYQVLYELALNQTGLEPVPADAFDLHSTQKEDVARTANDGDLHTRWGTGEPQKPGMQFVAELHEPLPIRGVRISTGDWETDFPRGLRIEAELADGQRQKLFDESQYVSALYYLNHNSTFRVAFPPVEAKRIILTQTGADTLFDWSIAELQLER